MCATICGSTTRRDQNSLSGASGTCCSWGGHGQRPAVQVYECLAGCHHHRARRGHQGVLEEGRGKRQLGAERIPHQPSGQKRIHTTQFHIHSQGLWRGTIPGQLLAVPYTAVQFIALQQCKLFAKQLGFTDKHSTAVSFGSGAVAGVAATCASYPFDLLRTTLAAQGEPKVGMLCGVG